MNTRRLLLLLIPIALVVTLLSHVLYDVLTVESVQTVPIAVKVDDHFGLNADPGELNFGRLIPDTQGERTIKLSNTGEKTLIVHIESSGEVGEWVRTSANHFELEPGRTADVLFTMSVPAIEYGVYNGTATIVFRKKLFS